MWAFALASAASTYAGQVGQAAADGDDGGVHDVDEGREAETERGARVADRAQGVFVPGLGTCAHGGSIQAEPPHQGFARRELIEGADAVHAGRDGDAAELARPAVRAAEGPPVHQHGRADPRPHHHHRRRDVRRRVVALLDERGRGVVDHREAALAA